MKYGEVPSHPGPQVRPGLGPSVSARAQVTGHHAPNLVSLPAGLGRMALTTLLLVGLLLGRTDAQWEGEQAALRNLCSS